MAIPSPHPDMFGNITFEEPLPITMHLDYLHHNGAIAIKKNGPRYKAFEVNEPDNEYLKIDLFLVVPPAQWGVIFTIRTGSAEFSKRLVTKKKHGGYMPSNMKQKDGQLWIGLNNGQWLPLETPEEIGYFEALGIDWVRPQDRI